MIRHRAWVVLLAGLPALLTTAQLAGVVDLAPTLPIYCLLCAVIIVLDARVRSLPTIALLSAPAAVFLVLRLLAIVEWPSGGPATVVTELVAIGLTALLARRVGRNIEEFGSAAERLLATDISMTAIPIEEAQREIYSELQRARSFERPVTLLSIAAAETEQGSEATMKLIEGWQMTALRRYVHGRVAGLLSEEVRGYDILATRGDHLVSVLPETDSVQAGDVIQRLRTSCREELGIELRIGSSSFPEQELTFDKLLDRAELEMRGARPPSTKSPKFRQVAS